MNIIENDFSYIGYPCFGKIINQLSNGAEIPEYTAFVLSVLKTDKVDNPTLLVYAQESSLLPNSPIKNADLICFKEGITEENVFEFLMEESRIKKQKNCTRYYKRFDTRLSLCKLCPRSPYYRNKYINEEYALLKFILSNRSNMQYFKELLKRYPSFEFTVAEDLATEYQTKNTYVYNCNAIFFECLKKHEDIIYFSYNNYAIILKSSFSQAVKEGRRLPNSISEKENWSLVAIDKILKRIDSAQDYSKEKVEQFIIRWCEEEKERKAFIQDYESKIADGNWEGVPTAISDFTPKKKKSGQKKKTKKEEITDNNEEVKPMFFDPRNLITISLDEETDDIEEIEETPVLTECDNKEIAETKPATEELTAPEVILEDTNTFPTDTDKTKEELEDMAAVVSEEIINSTETFIKEENQWVENDTENISSAEEETYSDDDLIFDMYSNNIENFYQETEEICDTQTSILYEEFTEQTEDKENTEIEVVSDSSDNIEEVDKITMDNNTQNPEHIDTVSNSEEIIELPAIRTSATVTLFKKPIYPDMEQFDDTIEYREIALPPMERQLILEHTISNDLLEQCVPLTDDLILLAEIETAILKERYFCMELLKDEKDNELFLFYIHKLHRYFYTRLDSIKVREVFIPLFKMPSVKKYCYIPYYIKGYCTVKDIKLRSLTSIYTMQNCSTEDNELSLGDLCVKYMPYGQQALKKALENASPDQWFYSIAYYRTIASKIKINEKMLTQADAVNEVLGTSYLAKHSFYTEDRLFTMENDGKITFQNELYKKWLEKVRFNGYSVRYTVSAEQQIQKESIYSMLAFLSLKGYINKRKIQLIALNDTTAYFYISKEDFPYLDTIIQTYLFQYGRRIDEYQTNISYEYHLC